MQMSEQWKNLCDEYSAHSDFLIEQIIEKNKKILRYKQALEFYADGDKYKTDVISQWEPVIPAMKDNGEKARRALAGESK